LRYLHGPLTGLGCLIALASAAVDQGVKLWLLYVFDLGGRGAVRLGPFLDLVLIWNTGISYGLFPQQGQSGQWLLFVIKIVAVVVLWVWLARAPNRLTAIALGLIMGGALGNAVDRAAHGAVVDFLLFHISTSTWRFNWYVFNLADVAIVAGVIGVLYESFVKADAQKVP
jgi:signal peptidase II